MLTFSRIYYQGDPKCLPVCTLPIHTLLHLADYIKCWGPVWCYWAFPMEQFCGHLKHGGAKSKRFSYKSLDHYLFDWTVLWHLGAIYDLHETLCLHQHRANNSKFPIWGCGSKVPYCPFVHLHGYADEGYLLSSPQLSNSPTLDNDFLLQLVYNIMACLQNLPIHPYRVWDALKAATFYEW